MATYYVNSGAGGANTGADWTNAYTAFGSAVTAATSDNDVILVHYTHTEELSAATTYTFAAANIQVYSVDKDSSDALTVMGAAAWIGASSGLGRQINIVGGRRVYIYGVTFLTSSASGGTTLNLSGGDGGQLELDSCYLWHGATATSSYLLLGGNNDSQGHTIARNCTFRFGTTGRSINFCGSTEIIGGSISSDGSAITTVFQPQPVVDITGAILTATGFDLSAADASATLLGDNTVTPSRVILDRCKIPSSPTYLGTQTNKNLSSGSIELRDCASGDTHGVWVYANAFGQVVTNTSITYTGSTWSWKIDTTADASPFMPFVTPWTVVYHSGTASITPYFEILRDGSATAYQDDEVWAEFTAKTTTGSVIATTYRDRMALRGTPANQAAGAGLGSWAGEAGTAWSGKIDSGSAFTPAEVGDIAARVCVGEPSITVYVDPVIRT